MFEAMLAQRRHLTQQSREEVQEVFLEEMIPELKMRGISKTWKKGIPDRGNSIRKDMEAWGYCKLSIRVQVDGGEVLEVVGRDWEGTGRPCGGLGLLTIKQSGVFERF